MRKAIAAALLAAALLTGCRSSDEGGAEAAAGFPKPTIPYTSEQAVKNGDIVNVHGKYANLKRWKTFMDHVQSAKPGYVQVRITGFTIEGSPIFNELTYDGKRMRFTYDNAMDAYGSDLGRPSSACAGIGKKPGFDGADEYMLTGCDGEAGQYFRFRVVPEK